MLTQRLSQKTAMRGMQAGYSRQGGVSKGYKSTRHDVYPVPL